MQACVQSESDGCASAHESRGGEYTAVLSVKERELRGHSVLYMRVSSTMKKKKIGIRIVLFTTTKKSLFVELLLARHNPRFVAEILSRRSSTEWKLSTPDHQISDSRIVGK